MNDTVHIKLYLDRGDSNIPFLQVHELRFANWVQHWFTFLQFILTLLVSNYPFTSIFNKHVEIQYLVITFLVHCRMADKVRKCTQALGTSFNQPFKGKLSASIRRWQPPSTKVLIARISQGNLGVIKRNWISSPFSGMFWNQGKIKVSLTTVSHCFIFRS